MPMWKLNDAIALATHAHGDQLDKAGKPYILHPLRVMLQMETEDEQIVGVLHDIVEDTEITLEEIEELYGPVIREGVDAMTRRADETYFQYIDRCKRNPIGRKVKIADTRDNLSPARLAQLPIETQGVAKRYEKALQILEAAE